MFFFLCIKMTNKYKKKQRKSPQKCHVKDIKIFLRKKKQKAKKDQVRYQNFTEEEKDKKR